mmetsp:Transcript_18224/g.30404  ORF Transcript_18224/g.30404 Transcript_18224/m.30404 type:complete len:667 (+) Transcript_18224:46-2046(+)
MRLLILSCCFAVSVYCASSAVTAYAPKHGLSDHVHVFLEPQELEVSSELQSCCDLIRQHSPKEQDHLSLIQCVNRSAVTNYKKVTSMIPYTQHPQQQGPKLNVAIVTRATPHVYDYASYAFFLQAVYAEHNGYYSLPLLPDSARPDYRRYRKLVPLLDAMTTHAADADYIVWLDADLVLLDLGMRVEQVAAQYPTAHLIVSADVSSLANSGFVIMRNSAFVVKLLNRWLQNREISEAYADQAGFEHLYNAQLSDKERTKIAIVRPDALNSEAPAMGRQATHNQVLHLAAEGTVMRRNSFAAGAKEVCAALQERRRPAHQLKMTREALRNIAERSYRAENNAVFARLEGLTYEEGEEEALLLGVSQLRQDASKYVYTLHMKNGEKDTPEVFEVRRRTIALMTRVVDTVVESIFRSLSLTRTPEGSALMDIIAFKKTNPPAVARLPAFTLLLNLVKSKVEMTYELVMSLQTNIVDGHLSSDSLQEWQGLLDVVSESLEFLKDAVSGSQQHIIMDMQASFYGSTGEMLMALEENEQAIDLLRRGHAIYKSLNADGLSGDTRSLSSLTSALAQALCLGEHFDEGLALHTSVIRDEEATVGMYHYRLTTKYLKAASCALQAHQLQRGRKWLDRAEESLKRNPDVSFGDYDRNSLRLLRSDLERLEQGHPEL